ncbi:MAG: hypothetical protein LBQ79_01590 [Deltaproteobacteria bacterium]|jgi:cbb3-type cytochrome oxidase subunit 3|nr:hypothetical protein [Deltaproteobacteria bacterium]
MEYSELLRNIAWGTLAFSVLLVIIKWIVASRLRKARKEESARERPLPAGPGPEPSGNP